MLRAPMAPHAGLLLGPPERAYSCGKADPGWRKLQWQINGAMTARHRKSEQNDTPMKTHYLPLRLAPMPTLRLGKMGSVVFPLVLFILVSACGDKERLDASPDCEVGTHLDDSLTSFDQMPTPIRLALEERFKKWDEYVGLPGMAMVPRDAEWFGTHEFPYPPKMLSHRRFISGGRHKQRWYVIYEFAGVGLHLFHMVVADLDVATEELRFVTNSSAALEDLCEFAPVYMENLDLPGPGLDDGLEW